jgi:hypothetical protein
MHFALPRQAKVAVRVETKHVASLPLLLDRPARHSGDPLPKFEALAWKEAEDAWSAF